jgi:hypothetical protein|tara:strand:- start:2939 stop:3385 length:447 start_codon:yes stop_codon:yes gene_type:complete
MATTKKSRSAKKKAASTIAPKEVTVEEEVSAPPVAAAALKPKTLPRLAPEGIRTFTVARQYDETGISGEGVVIEGVTLATGQCVVHWLYPPPRGGIAIFDSMNDFIKVHIQPHPSNRTIITYDDGEQERFGLFSEEEKPSDEINSTEN